MQNNIFKIVILIVSLCFFTFCHSYKKLGQTISELRLDYNAGNYAKAVSNINHNEFYTNKHNKVLLYLELGKAKHLQQKYDSSNFYLNQADLLMEDKLKLSDYKGDMIDKIIIHYYMALNYLYLNKNEDALVEAKRIDLRLKEMGDRFTQKNKVDPFAQILQGIIYERLNNYDDAFIAYRDAYEIYEKQGIKNHLGVDMPQQLISDLINAANKAHNISNRDFYCQKFNIKFETIKDTSKNKLLFFWENGITPVKKQESIDFRLIKDKSGNTVLFDQTKNILIPLVISTDNRIEFMNSNLKSVRVSYAVLVEPQSIYTTIGIQSTLKTVEPELIENIAHSKQINELTYNNLNRFVNNNIASELANRKKERVAAKKLAEEALVKKKAEVDEARKKAEDELSKLKSEDERVAKKKDMEAAQKKADQDIAKLKKEVESPRIKSNSTSLTYSYSNAGDTRCWQSLPAKIFYTKLPVLKDDKNVFITLTSTNGTVVKDTLSLNTDRRLNVINYVTLNHVPCDVDAFIPLRP